MPDLKDDQEQETDGVSRRNMLALSGGGAVALAGAAAVALAAKPAKAQTTAGGKLQQVLERGHLIVGTGSTNPPWHMEDQDGKLIGMDIDMAKLLAKGLFEDPEKVEFVLQAADSRIPNLVTDKVDVCVQFMTVTPGRAQQVDFTIPYYREGVGLMLMADSQYADRAALQAAGSAVTVSALQNVFIADWVHMALPEAKVDEYDSVDAGLQALNAKRADAFIYDQSAIAWQMSQFPGRYRDSGYGWMPNTYAAAVRQGDQNWLNWVNTVFHEAMAGVDFLVYQASFKKWFGQEIPPPKVGFPVEYQ
jgi:polar amino acid transport system substrate-binding protein